MTRWSPAWLPMVAIANGAARDLGFGPLPGELRAHRASTLAAMVLSGIYICFALRRLRPASMGEAWTGGALWLVMTVAFGFLFGHCASGKSWPQLLENRDRAAGRWWPALLAWICPAPPLFHRLRFPLEAPARR